MLGSGSSSSYQNDADGWFSDARTSSGCGTRGNYYDLPIQALRMADDSGSYVEYTLTAPYSGRSLYSIVTECMGSDRTNDGSSLWDNGHCVGVASLSGSSGVSGADDLRIGVGDGSSGGSSDWALIMPI